MQVRLPDGTDHEVTGLDVPVAIARHLRDFGYPDVTEDDVQAQLAKPSSERNVIGMMAYKMLKKNHFVP